MNKEEILNKYIDLIDKSYCCDCNELNCIDNFPHAKITHAIRELQQQNKQLQEKIEYLERSNNRREDTILEQRQEISNLEDNWNKLKEYFNERVKVCDNRLSSPFCNFEKATKERLIFSQCLEKLEELEQGSDNE